MKPLWYILESAYQTFESQVEINVPIYKDTETPDPFVEFPDIPAAKPDHVYMDAMGFGMGCCCIQVTFQVKFF